ncbi:hypothetical protein ACFQ6U_30655 [Streptomyces sp. NPDC056465]
MNGILGDLRSLGLREADNDEDMIAVAAAITAAYFLCLTRAEVYCLSYS